MRTTSFLGLLLGLAVVALAVRAGGGDGSVLTHGDAWLLVLGGAFAAAILSSSWATARQTLSALSRLFVTGGVTTTTTSAALVELARHARAGGLAAIDPVAIPLRDPFLVTGLQLLADGVDAERIEALLGRESERLSGPRARAEGLLRLMGRSAALVGAACSLVALVQLPPGPPGSLPPWPAMAATLPAACYGLLLAGLLFLPLAARVQTLDRQERLVRDLAIRGLLAIRLGQNPEFLREALADLAGKNG